MATSDGTNSITMFPMTSIFTPPAACSTFWTYEPEAANNIPDGLLLQNAATFVSSCFPSGFNNIGRVQGTRVFSPGYCPMGYTSGDFAVGGSTTTAICCLSNFEYSTSIMIYDDLPSATYAGCVSTFPQFSSSLFPIRQNTNSTEVTGPVTMWAQPITVELQLKDLSIFVSASSSSTAPSAVSATTTQSEPSSTLSSTTSLISTTSTANSESSGVPTTSTVSSNTGSTGLSTAAGIGVGVGVGVGGLAIFAAIGLWFWRQRKSSKNFPTAKMNASHGPPYYGENKQWPPLELDASHSRDHNAPHELYA
ncbi:hypothetical protein ARAM_005775 [Aspergillus rambellii]|uniref:Mid2 domain-containing protein n=1 Tax=Aspergillus rambellii TaxID=308745 RepID=A0A0F8WVT2_9EURO|nr:hypothetical protein ARAM_005775 [Aspergillus rambellii]